MSARSKDAGRAKAGKCSAWCVLAVCAVWTAGCRGLLGGAAARPPWESMLKTPEEVSAEYHCRGRRLPFLHMVTAELSPSAVKPGGLTSFRFVYSLCLADGVEFAKGRLRTRIISGASTIGSDSV